MNTKQASKHNRGLPTSKIYALLEQQGIGAASFFAAINENNGSIQIAGGV